MSAPAPYDAIILGAGGAGLMCAIVAGQRGRQVPLLEHDAVNREGKILISGGGRCNFTNSSCCARALYLARIRILLGQRWLAIRLH